MKIFRKISMVIIAALIMVVLSACNPALNCEEGFVEEEGACVAIVVPDETAPEFMNVIDVAYTIDSDVVPDYVANVTVNDNVDGDITDNVVIDDSLVNLDVEGTYVVTLTVQDAAGNEATTTLNVVVTEEVIDYLALAQADLDAVVIGDDLVLPQYTQNLTFFYWSSTSPEVITNRGFVIPPTVSQGPIEVTLTGRAVNGPAVVTKDFVVTVQPWGEVEVTSKVTVPFEGKSEEYIVADDPEVDLYYVDEGTVPYIDIETYFNMLQGAIEATELVFTPTGDDQLVISYDVEYEDFDGTMINETYEALLDFTDNTIAVDTFDFFSSYVSETESDYGEGLTYVDAEYADPDPVTIPLGEYNVDILMYDDNGETKYLMPFAVTNLLFAHGLYYDAYFNGDKIYGIDTFSLSGIDTEDPLWTEVRTSSLNDADMEEDMKWATYHFMALAFDYFYGLKEDQKVDTYYSTLAGRAQGWITGSDRSLYDGLFDFTYGLDDLHTSYTFSGYYNSPGWPGLSINDFGPRSRGFYEQGIWAMQDKLEAKYGSLDAKPDHRIIDEGKTAVIYLDGFTIDSPDEFKAIMDGLPGTVENVVVDLSYNTGGNIGAVFRIFGYMTDERFQYSSQNPADNSAYTLFIESSYVAYDYDWYIISSKVSFSAANLMIAMAQQNNIATVMGTRSSGGASSIGNIFTPDGTSLLVSTNSVLSIRTGNETDGYVYESVEYGVEPDYLMSDETSDSEIIRVITSHKSTD